MNQYKQAIQKLQYDHKRSKETVVEETSNQSRLQAHLATLDESIEIVQHIAQGIQQQVHQQVSAVVTRCLNSVFDDPYEFEIRFDRRRNKTEATLLFKRDGMILDDPLNEVGGGVLDIASLALRLSVILLSRPRQRKLVILDEPFSNIRGEQNKERTRQMLLALAEDLGFSFIINTDIPAYQLGTIVECEK